MRHHRHRHHHHDTSSDNSGCGDNIRAARQQLTELLTSSWSFSCKRLTVFSQSLWMAPKEDTCECLRRISLVMEKYLIGRSGEITKILIIDWCPQEGSRSGEKQFGKIKTNKRYFAFLHSRNAKTRHHLFVARFAETSRFWSAKVACSANVLLTSTLRFEDAMPAGERRDRAGLPARGAHKVQSKSTSRYACVKCPLSGYEEHLVILVKIEAKTTEQRQQTNAVETKPPVAFHSPLPTHTAQPFDVRSNVPHFSPHCLRASAGPARSTKPKKTQHIGGTSTYPHSENTTTSTPRLIPLGDVQVVSDNCLCT